MHRAGWAALALIAGAVFFWAARSHFVYDATLPDELGGGLQVVLRKAYSLVAFAIVGVLADRALPAARRPALRAALIVALFSGLIEVGQRLHGSTEGRASNLLDVLCGALGGWLGVTLVRALFQSERGEERR